MEVDGVLHFDGETLADKGAIGEAGIAPIGPLCALPVPIDVAEGFDARILADEIEIRHEPRLPC